MKQLFILFFSLVPLFAVSQKLKKNDKATIDYITQHVNFLASDELEGRRAGTEAEKKAAEYIKKELTLNGLTPGNKGSYIQTFDIYDGRKISSNSHLLIDGNELTLQEDYFPLPFSGNGNNELLASPALPERNNAWFVDLGVLLKNETLHPHFDYLQSIKNYADEIAEKGAAALFVYNTHMDIPELIFDKKNKIASTSIPVFYLNSGIAKKYLSDKENLLDINFSVQIEEAYRKSQNVIGYIDNNAPQTVIIGAHYDHLGYGEDGNSTDRSGQKQIHNGADDNASGTALMIYLSRYIKSSSLKNSNYLFIAFGAEELGLNGSKYFVENPTIDLSTIKYMINMDMVGRMKDQSFTIGGYGTSPYWGVLFNDQKLTKDFKIHFDSTGVGPSDHASFYRKDIPVLFFFTGSHTDYHKPSDDADKINYTGIWQIGKLVEQIIESADKTPEIAFTKTSEPVMSTGGFRVTLGVMPDYTFSGEGVRIDGVTAGRPADKAGIKAGDIILKIGDIHTSSMEGYMNALNTFNKGETTELLVKRGEEVLTLNITF